MNNKYYAKVVFEDGNSLVTGINGSPEEIARYYNPGNIFNIGSKNPDIEDNLQSVKNVDVFSVDGDNLVLSL